MEEAAPPSAVCHSVFGNNLLHFSSKMGKQSAISPITPHCGGVLAGLMCGESELSGVRQRCDSSTCYPQSPSLAWISICLYSCAKKKRNKENKHTKKTQGGQRVNPLRRTVGEWIIWLQIGVVWGCVQDQKVQWPHVNVSSPCALWRAPFLPCRFQGW